MAVDGDAGEVVDAAGGDHRARDDHGPRSHARHQLGRDGGCRADAEGERQVSRAGLDGRVAQHVLHVES